jgi:hypothetical protein
MAYVATITNPRTRRTYYVVQELTARGGPTPAITSARHRANRYPSPEAANAAAAPLATALRWSEGTEVDA